MNLPEPEEKNCVTTYADLEHWMEFLIYPMEKEFDKHMTNTIESPPKNNKKRRHTEEIPEEEIKPKKLKTVNIAKCDVKCAVKFCRNFADKNGISCSQCHFKNPKRCLNKIDGGVKYCNSHYGGRLAIRT